MASDGLEGGGVTVVDYENGLEVSKSWPWVVRESKQCYALAKGQLNKVAERRS